MHEDLDMWLTFINHPSIYARNFADFSTGFNTQGINMFSDVSKVITLGYGGVCGSSWMYGQWEPNFIEDFDPSIEYLKLFALVGTVLNWIHRYKNKRILLFCDNQSMVHMVNNTSSSCANCMVLLRKLILKGLTENIRIFAKYIRSADNKASDYLSHLKIEKFKQLRPDWDEQPTPIPSEIWPISKIWKY